MADTHTGGDALFTTQEPDAYTEVAHGGTEHHAEPELLGLAAFQWVSIAMLVLILIAVFKMKAHSKIGEGLDARIAAIREELDEAKRLRAEAEQLRDEYASKIANAESDAEAMLENAKAEAEAILTRAEEDSKALVERRKRMAEDKISAAEREAIAEVRAKAAAAAAAASRKLIGEKLDTESDRKLADELIAGI
ncbi:F0F1 ATP synthase subunit B family protein [Alteriqipengyuania sp. 357]